MAKYKDYSYEQTVLLPVSFSNQILPGTFEYTLNSVIDDLDLSIFEERFTVLFDTAVKEIREGKIS